MTQEKTIRLFWFSGSGNTLAAATTLALRLRDLGHKVVMLPMESCGEVTLEPTELLCLALPTYFFSIPEKVREFVRNLPPGRGTDAVMFTTCGGFSGGVCGPMKRLLARKGYHCRAARVILMPDSFFPFTPLWLNRRLERRAMAQVERFADEIVAEQGRWRRWPILSDLFGMFCSCFFELRRIPPAPYTTVSIRRNACIGCGLCEKYCPAHALHQNETQGVETPGAETHNIPLRDRKCVNCLRCVAICPRNATRHLVFPIYRREDSAGFAKKLETALHPASLNPASRDEYKEF